VVATPLALSKCAWPGESLSATTTCMACVEPPSLSEPAVPDRDRTGQASTLQIKQS